MLIVMGPVLEVSTLDLFRGAFIPGAVLATLYLLYTLGRCWLNPELGPVLSEEAQPKTSDFYGAEIALISMGVLTICRVFGLGLAGSFGGLLPFGGTQSSTHYSIASVQPLLPLHSIIHPLQHTTLTLTLTNHPNPHPHQSPSP